MMNQIAEKQITQRMAAEHLGISIRQVKRIWSKYQKQGIEGLINKSRGKPSHNQYEIPKVEPHDSVDIHIYLLNASFAEIRVWNSSKLVLSFVLPLANLREVSTFQLLLTLPISEKFIKSPVAPLL